RAFADRVVDGLPRSAEKPLHLMVCDPGGDLFAGELAAIVGSEGFRRRSALLDELVEGDRSAKAGRHSDDEFVTLIAGACTGFAQDEFASAPVKAAGVISAARSPKTSRWVPSRSNAQTR